MVSFQRLALDYITAVIDRGGRSQNAREHQLPTKLAEKIKLLFNRFNRIHLILKERRLRDFPQRVSFCRTKV